MDLAEKTCRELKPLHLNETRNYLHGVNTTVHKRFPFFKLQPQVLSRHNVLAFGCELGLFNCFKSMHVAYRDQGSICLEVMTSRLVIYQITVFLHTWFLY